MVITVHDRDKGLGLFDVSTFALGEGPCIISTLACAVCVGSFTETGDLVVELELCLEEVERLVAGLNICRIGSFDNSENVASGAEGTTYTSKKDDIASCGLDAFVESTVDERDHFLVECIERLLAVEKDGAEPTSERSLTSLSSLAAVLAGKKTCPWRPRRTWQECARTGERPG